MEYRTHSGEELSAIGIGCYGVGGAYGAKDPEQFVRLFQALDRFLDAEDERLRDEQFAELRAILKAEARSAQEFADIVYVLETLVELGLVEERQVLPVFQQLWALRDGSHPADMARLRASLREQFLSRLNDHVG
jgi:hypothetical protein